MCELIAALGGRKIEPLVRLDKVLRHALALSVHETEIVLGSDVTLVSQLAENPKSRWIIGAFMR